MFKMHCCRFSSIKVFIFSGAHRRLFRPSCRIHVLFSSSCHQCSSCSPSSKSRWGRSFTIYALQPTGFLLQWHLFIPQEQKDTRQQRLEMLNKIEKVPAWYLVLFLTAYRVSLLFPSSSCLSSCWRWRKWRGWKARFCLKQKKWGWGRKLREK